MLSLLKLCMTHADYTKPLIKALLEPELNHQNATSPAGEDGSVRLRTEPEVLTTEREGGGFHEMTDNK